ncbi:uncharacterized protein B0J16DRAFT_322445 [Fusarium flagelliforme]|uniref:uncharacterized protein n=1 Tax=Fusarium flagelliforme TaxID=2675880 RepID=UPI001E8D8DEC|nr:uncharacterized protein B0J16DRAFT_322445 [Fusarium flagelliforme]KAH7178955.1 hypothetical protein B0J16DRAFT_322445 [Fusarium flagelliforme]
MSLNEIEVWGQLSRRQGPHRGGQAVNMSDPKDQLNPLYCAAKGGNPHICKYLLESGADPNVELQSGKQYSMLQSFQANWIFLISLSATKIVSQISAISTYKLPFVTGTLLAD